MATHSSLTYINTRELVGLPGNPRKITQRDLNILCDSIRQNGFYEHRPCAVERQDDHYIVLDGNQRLKAARRLKMKTVPTKKGGTLKDPIDGHEMTATEAIAYKMMEKALSGDVRACQFIMQLEAQQRLQNKRK